MTQKRFIGQLTDMLWSGYPDFEIEKLLSKHDLPLPDCCLKTAEWQRCFRPVLDYVMAYGSDDEYLSPLMMLIKKGFSNSAIEIALVTTGTLHDFTDKDQYGMTVLDWAFATREWELLRVLKRCRKKSQ